ncbi:TetR/AcrR family transcriptional regulator [Manganibacter manganicus]|uniref:TetR family transcriptional regulator n=1 Tax=Manganibacter manganicus TaxID=1873176 RepID=A0A1V8RUR2_9HYPH|nr:TetR/AcrR family transcriptional regulator [Pseudaminobacter manganicus]OQM76931.1 TetR family transcriptional regulator [Pseudaminobacter manganicus]
MQRKIERRTNRQRTEATRAALLSAARTLFIEKSYAETATPEIVAAAGVTRGALYHHFTDKQALFQAVVEQEAAEVAAGIERATPTERDARQALLDGGRAFLDAMASPGRTRLLLLDGPAVLGRATMDKIDARHGARTLREGLEMAMQEGAMKPASLDVLTALLSAAFDRAALSVESGAAREDFMKTLGMLIDGLFKQQP